MGLREKSLLFALLCMAAQLSALLLIARAVLLDGFTAIEEDEMVKNMERLGAAAEEEVARLETTARDWAAWNDTVAFVQGRDEGYAESNLNAATLVNHGLNFMWFFDESGQPFHLESASLSEEATVPADPKLLAAALARPNLSHLEKVDDRASGLLVTPDVMAMIAAHPIIASDYGGPVAGTLLIGRYLDTVTEELTARVILDRHHVYAYDAPDLPDGIRRVCSHLDEKGGVLVESLDEKQAASYVVVDDYEGNPGLIAEVISPRAIHRQGVKTLLLFLGLVVAIDVILALAGLAHTNGMVVGRVRALSRSVVLIRRQKRLSNQVEVRGSDEISALGTEINAMLGTIQSASAELERVRAAVDDASDGVLIMNDQMAPLYVNHAFAKLFPVEDLDDLSEKGLESIFNGQETLREIVAAVRNGDAWDTEELLVGRDGKTMETHVRATGVVSEDGQLAGALFLFTDITERKEIEKRLRTLSEQDGLTGVANRRTFDNRLTEEWNRGSRARSNLALLMLDVDHFKRFNDEYGHQAGDQALKAVANAAKAALQRKTDLVARYGGEEFAAILPATSLASATELAEKVRAEIEGLRIRIPEREGFLRVTVSVGAACVVPKRGADPADLVRAADGALYQAKASGRNRVESADDGD